MKIDANDVGAILGPDGLRLETERLTTEALARKAREEGLYSLPDLRSRFGSDYRPAVIDGLLRQGETLNIVAPSKIGKSWLAYSLALSAVAGRPWLNHRWFCAPGPVAIIDNELHPETISARLKAVRETMELPPEVENHMMIATLRGKWKPLDELNSVIQHLMENPPVLVILDSLYRFLPEGCSENDNAAMAQVYNQIDTMSATLERSGVVVIHHASKGNQAGKSVTEVGRGAGAISGATDSHLILREHEEADCFVAEAVTRTWPKPEPIVLRWNYPLWESTEHDPERLKRTRPQVVREKPPEALNDAAFCTYLQTDRWTSKRELVEIVYGREHFSRDAVRSLVAGVISSHGLDELSASDGPKACGLFEAKVGERGGGLHFRARTGGEK
jgi:hypothetical protein